MRSPLPVMSPILPCPPCLPWGVWGQGVQGGGFRSRGLGRGGGLGERGQGTFHLPCHILHCHMVLRPKGTSNNDKASVASKLFSLRTSSSERARATTEACAPNTSKKSPECPVVLPNRPHSCGCALSCCMYHKVCIVLQRKQPVLQVQRHMTPLSLLTRRLRNQTNQ